MLCKQNECNENKAVMLLYYFLDSECPDICTFGGCSFRCSREKICPSGYACMGGRCYTSCVFSASSE